MSYGLLQEVLVPIQSLIPFAYMYLIYALKPWAIRPLFVKKKSLNEYSGFKKMNYFFE